MKKIFIMVVLMSMLCVPSFARADIEKKNQVIFSEYIDGSKVWIPSQRQVEEALTAVLKHLDDIDRSGSYPKGQLKKIRKRFSEYKVQFVGLKGELNKRIMCNFFRADQKHPDWQESFVFVFDGGDQYWQIEYDVDTKQCAKLSINGDA